jgi:hypothetical protein
MNINIAWNIRGTSGCGKSTLVRATMDHFGVQFPLQQQGKKPWGYKLNGGLFVLGNYDTPCGGADTIGSFSAIENKVRELIKHGDVLFEGLLYSTVFKSSHEFDMSLAPNRVIFLVLNTPLPTCITGVLERRKAAGNDETFDAEKLITKYRSVQSAAKRLREAGHDVKTVPHERALEWMLEVFADVATIRRELQTV